MKSDHVMPKSWYPDSTPPNLEKWQAPSCQKCNGALGSIENALYQKFAMCLDGSDNAASGLVEKAFRAMDPTAGRDEKDSAKRAVSRRRLLEQIIPYREVELTSVIPGFGPSASVPIEEQVAVEVPADMLHQLVVKMVRGFTYVFGNGAYIEPEYEIVIRFDMEEDVQFLADIVAKYAVQRAIGPGIVVDRAAPPEDEACGIFKVTVWDRFTFWAIVGPKSES